jgi:hypothetical protein
MFTKFPSVETSNIPLFENSNEQFINQKHPTYFIEKYDGSNFCIQFDGKGGIKQITNKSGGDITNSTNHLFLPTINIFREIKLNIPENYVFCAELIVSNKTFKYKKLPKYNIIVYGIYDNSSEKWYQYPEIIELCTKYELEYAGIFGICKTGDNIYTITMDLIRKLNLNLLESSLGGNPEGFVITNPMYENERGVVGYRRKIVSNYYKECNEGVIKIYSIQSFCETYGKLRDTIPRFNKTIQHLKEREIELTKESIITELDMDFDKEYLEEITEILINTKLANKKNIQKIISENINKIHEYARSTIILDKLNEYK